MGKNFLLIFLFLSGAAAAQSQQKIGLKEAIKQGLDASKSLKISEGRALGAETRLQDLKYSQIPTVSVSTAAYKLSDIDPIRFGALSIPFPSHNYSNVASVSEPIFAGFRARYMLKSAEYLQNAAKYDLERDRKEVVLNIVNAYFNLYKLKVSKALLDENQKQIEQHLQDVTQFEQSGLATQNDVLKVQLQQSNIQLSSIDADNNLKIAGYNFATLMGQQDKQLFDVDTVNLFAFNALQPLEAYMQDAVSKRAEVKSLELKAQSASAAVEISKGKFYPFVAVGANYYYSNPNPRVFPPADKFTATWDVGASLRWDISNLVVNKPAVNQARIAEEESRLTLSSLNENLRSEVNQSYFACVQSKEKVAVAQKSVIQAVENYRIMNVRYTEHVALLTDLLDANVMLLQAKMNLAVAKADAEVSYYKLLKSSGILE